MKRFGTLIALLWLCSLTFAQTPTWNSGVGQLIYNSCANCHHEGGIGPFSLMSYEDAISYASSIKYHTTDRHMPPWKADPSYSHFIGERRLSDDQVKMISDWVDAGTPLGTGVSPIPPSINNGAQINRIDQTAKSPKYTVQKTTDDYRTFVMPTTHTSLKYINAVEFIPSNAGIVHHIILYHDPSTYSRNLDSLDPGPGYASNGTGAESPNAKLIGLWTPGAGIFYLPDNMGYELPVGTDLVMEIHYAPNSNAKSDSTTINFKYTSTSPVRVVKMDMPLYHYPPVLQQPALQISANTVATFNQRAISSNSLDLSIIGIFPHMHLIGKSYTIFAKKGTDTTKLIRIPDWDFHWQGFYTFQKLIKISKQSLILATGVYDNTTNNPHNPSNPPIDVSAGENTKDEMMVTFIAYTTYQPGDENIILDSTLITNGVDENRKSKIVIYPNPADDKIQISSDEKVESVKIHQLDGRLIEEYHNSSDIDISSLSEGMYFLEIKIEGKVYFEKIIVRNSKI